MIDIYLRYRSLIVFYLSFSLLSGVFNAEWLLEGIFLTPVFLVPTLGEILFLVVLGEAGRYEPWYLF